MLAPIITKDMKLFPSRPLPQGIKNVRSRAQSLDQFNQATQPGTSRMTPVRARNSVSTGNLPSAATRSPPSSVPRKTTLSAIEEGVEMKIKENRLAALSQAVSSEPSLRTGTIPGKKMTPEQAAKISAAKASKDKSVSGSSSSDSASEDGDQKPQKKNKKKKSVVKWLTGAFRKSKDDSSIPESASTVSS